jgi:tmRNA-binding protein
MTASNAALRAKLVEAGAAGRDVKSLSDETEAARAAAEQRKALEKALRGLKMAEENAAMRAKLRRAPGRNDKSLSVETEAVRTAVEERRQGLTLVPPQLYLSRFWLY